MKQSSTGFHHLPDQGPVPDRSDIHLSAKARSRHNFINSPERPGYYRPHSQVVPISPPWSIFL